MAQWHGSDWNLVWLNGYAPVHGAAVHVDEGPPGQRQLARQPPPCFDRALGPMVIVGGW